MDVKVICPCPPKAGGGTRHPDGDVITLRETLDFRSVTAIRSNISMLEDGTNAGDIFGVLTEGYIVYGIVSWTLVDDDGDPIGVSRRAITEHILSRVDIAADVGDEADSLYGEKVVLPLLSRGRSSSPPTPTEPTSPRTQDSTPSSLKSRRPSKPSSISTTQTDDTVTTSSSPGGDSSSSQSSASAA